MKKVLNKIIIFALIFVMLLGGVAGCGEKTPTTLLPEYTAKHEFNTYAYGASSDGFFIIDGERVLMVEDAMSVERMKEYKEAGFSAMYITALGYYERENWEECPAKKIMENCHEAGLDKVLLTDFYLRDLANERLLVGEGSAYRIDSTGYSEPEYDGDDRTKEERAIDALVWERLQDYVNHPTFWGFNMWDEPTYELVESYGKLYKSIRRVQELHDLRYIYIHCNLGPLGFYTDHFTKYSKTEEGKYIDENGNELNYRTAYEKYVQDYIDATDCDRLSVDIYAFRSHGLFAGFFQTMQIFKEVCDRNGVEMTYVGQSFNTYNGQVEGYAEVSKSEMMYEANVALGMGVSGYAYYTYWPYTTQDMSGSKSRDNYNFLTLNGEKTKVYYYGQEVLAYMKDFNTVISNYDYLGAKMYRPDSITTIDVTPFFSSIVDVITKTTADWDNTHEFTLVKGVKYDNDILFMTELKDAENDLYMYMVQNVINPSDGKSLSTDINVEIDFGNEYKWVAEFDCGVLRYVELEDGVYKTGLSAGYANFIVPLK